MENESSWLLLNLTLPTFPPLPKKRSGWPDSWDWEKKESIWLKPSLSIPVSRVFLRSRHDFQRRIWRTSQSVQLFGSLVYEAGILDQSDLFCRQKFSLRWSIFSSSGASNGRLSPHIWNRFSRLVLSGLKPIHLFSYHI